MSRTEYLKAWRLANPEKAKEQRRRFYLRHRERLLEASKARYHDNAVVIAQRRKEDYRQRPEVKRRARELNYLRKYGVTLEHFETILMAQCGRCKICGIEVSIGLRGQPGACVDHSHVTGVVRGILCYNCNIALGLLGDSVDRAQALIDYIKSTQS